MGTKFDDFSTSSADAFFTKTNSSVETLNVDEEQLIKDGNDQVLKNFEALKKSRDYARSQTSRNKKSTPVNLNLVDWSGFPGAAHKKTPPPGERKEMSTARRSSVQKNEDHAPSSVDLERRAIRRSQRRLSANGLTGAHIEQPQEPPTPVSPRGSPTGRKDSKKYRNRRHAVQTKDGDEENAEAERLKRRGGLNRGTGILPRAERRGSESHHRGVRRNPASSASRSQSRSKSRTRRPLTEAQKRSLSPSTRLRSGGHRSTSPSGRMRRPVAAAVASTTFEIARDPRKNLPQRSYSHGRRRASQKPATDVDDALCQKASSFRW